MRAVLDRDIILNIVQSGGVDIGNARAAVGLERLRWDGTRLIDLMELTSIWVEPLPGGGFILHAIEVPGTTLVPMQYADRKRLVLGAAGVPRLATDAELAAGDAEAKARILQDQFYSQLRQKAGPLDAQVRDLRKLVFVLIAYVLTSNATARTLLAELLAEVRDIYTPAELATGLKTVIGQLRQLEESLAAQKTALK